MSWLAAPALLVLIGVPLALQPNWLIGAFAALAGLLAALGLIRHALGPVRLGGVVALAALTLALWPSAAPVSIAAGAGLGLALLYLLALVNFAGRFAGAAVERAAVWAQIRHWTAYAVVLVGLIVVLTLGAGGLAGLIPPLARPAVAAAGGLVAFVAAIRALRVRAHRRP